MKIIKGKSHLDHALTDGHIKHLEEAFAGRSESFIETFQLPLHLGDLPCALFGPAMGDEPISEKEVSYTRRGPRKYESRMVTRPERRTRTATVIAGEDAGIPCILYTCFGGPLTPQEPDDPVHMRNARRVARSVYRTVTGDRRRARRIARAARRAAYAKSVGPSREFWSTHALSK